MALRSEVDQRWAWYARRPNTVKDQAARRLKIILEIFELVDHDAPITRVVDTIAILERVSASTIWGWMRAIKTVERQDWLPFLAPSWNGGGRKAPVDVDAFTLACMEYLRPDAPTWAECFRRVKIYAEANSITIPHSKTMLRRVRREAKGFEGFLRREWELWKVDHVLFYALKRWGIEMRFGQLPGWKPHPDAIRC